MVRVKLNNLFYIGLVFICSTVISCDKKQKEQENKAVNVTTQKLSLGTEQKEEEYIGTVNSDLAVDVSFLVYGKIDKMYLQEGDYVQKGQLMASLDPSTLKNAHNLTLAALNQAKDAYNRMSAMYESKSIPEIQYVEYKTKLDQAKSSEAIALKNLNDGNLYAHQSGMISEKYVEAGANVVTGTPVYQIVDINMVKVKIAVPEKEISSIKKGMKCNVIVSALGNKSFEGVVVEKGVAANPISHTYDIKVQVNNADGQLLPGMVTKVYLNKGGEESLQLAIPLKSVQVDHTGKRYVWVKTAENKAEYREITLGKFVGNGVLVESGLKDGEYLITEGYQNISNGVEVIDNHSNN
ncbi:efflux RND transporter periplasmic adaptor subunit [Myroides injenensis]|uniref:efflux RND transporter periplasmic adaptor subunit n=1 Tax=Myroides injenensis TaxID=1183151 RepID=UPI000289A922|nr:efflux RND transporter periplasmic adaptor subunit [Myroides injenensis]